MPPITGQQGTSIDSCPKTCQSLPAVCSRYKPVSSNVSRLVQEDGSEMLDAAAAAADTWTQSVGRQPGWLITRRQHHPDRVSCILRARRRSYQRRHRTGSGRRTSDWIQF